MKFLPLAAPLLLLLASAPPAAPARAATPAAAPASPARAAPPAEEPPVLLLWPGGAPHSEGKTAEQNVKVTNGERVVTGVNKPSITVFLPPPPRATAAARAIIGGTPMPPSPPTAAAVPVATSAPTACVLIAPGGGHYQLSYDSEGCFVGQWLADRGIAGIVLTNRLSREAGSTYTMEDELADAQRAMRLVRSHAAEWNIDPAKLGMIGFSAGGELVNLLVQKHDDGNPAAADPVDRLGCKPAFQGLLYPGNAKSILPAKNSPPAFLLCGANDRADIAEELPNVYLRFKQAGIPAELHIYANTAHGFGYRPRSTTPANQWPQRFQEWLTSINMVKKPAAPAGTGSAPAATAPKI